MPEPEGSRGKHVGDGWVHAGVVTLVTPQDLHARGPEDLGQVLCVDDVLPLGPHQPAGETWSQRAHGAQSQRLTCGSPGTPSPVPSAGSAD